MILQRYATFLRRLQEKAQEYKAARVCVGSEEYNEHMPITRGCQDTFEFGSTVLLQSVSQGLLPHSKLFAIGLRKSGGFGNR